MTGRQLAAVALAAAAAAAALPAAGGAAAMKGTTRTARVVPDYFDPGKLTIRSGDRVTWRWTGGGLSSHDVTVDSGPERFHSPTQYRGSYSHRFVKAGTYKLICTQHEGMEQTVVVKRKRAH